MIIISKCSFLGPLWTNSLFSSLACLIFYWYCKGRFCLSRLWEFSTCKGLIASWQLPNPRCSLIFHVIVFCSHFLEGCFDQWGSYCERWEGMCHHGYVLEGCKKFCGICWSKVNNRYTLKTSVVFSLLSIVNSFNISSKNLVLKQLIIPLLIFFFTFLLDIVLILLGEILLVTCGS